MVSIGDRHHLTKHAFRRMADWASKHGYSALLLKQQTGELERMPHFNKLIAHRSAPGFDRYVIIDDDILIANDAPALPNIPSGKVGLCADAEQRNTEAEHVKWTANSGFVVINQPELHLLEEAYQMGEYPFKCGDGTNKGIWGPHDQGIVNDILFMNDKIHELDGRWNYQPVLDYLINYGGGWEKWSTSRWKRLSYYISLIFPFSNNRRRIARAFGVHLIRAPYPALFSFIIK
ncbi:MAG: hypothetical protein JKY70_01245 [Mucilaginibacter sp.]|nr:hypothetical protein [Mucilaginibacter sp.]